MRGPPPEGFSESEARAMALRYLGRRDYSELELSRKLEQRGVDTDTAAAVVDECVELGLVSDERFAEVFCRQRISRYYGPVKIRAELRSRGVSDALINAALPRHDEEWRDLAYEWVERRFRGELSQKEKARLYRGGRNRGFSHDHIMRAIDRLGTEYEKD